MHQKRDLNFVAFFGEGAVFSRRVGGLSYKRDDDARRLAFGCKMQILVSPRLFGMESHYICPFLYRLVLCIKKFIKNALTQGSVNGTNYCGVSAISGEGYKCT